MLSRMFSYIYRRPLDQVMRFSLAVMMEWAVLMYLIKGDFKRLKTVNKIGAAAAFLAVLGATILDRSVGSCSQVYLQPFSSFSAERFNAELCRECIMNVFLFLPLGIFMPFALPERNPHKVRTTVLFGLCVSVCVETIQLLFGLGWCEMDDVINNTLGVALGSRAYVLFEKIPQIINLWHDLRKQFYIAVKDRVEKEKIAGETFDRY